MPNETAEALANLATATAADQATVATLTDTISQLSSKLEADQAKLISSLLDSHNLLLRLSESGGYNIKYQQERQYSGGAGRGAASGGAQDPWSGPAIHYCWTHGAKCPHPSFKCPSLAANHIKNATKNNKLGGSATVYSSRE